jgi:cyclopropane-fatty-acyl-phospholipid synthase
VSITRVNPINLLPQAWRLTSVDTLSRNVFARVLKNIQVGSLTVFDGDDTLQFGTLGAAGEPQAQVTIHNRRVFTKTLTGGTIGSGESYMDGDWSSPDLTAVTRLFSANMAAMDDMESGQSWYVKLALNISHRLNRNSRDGSRKNISAHYDLGNDFFRLFLDPTMMYSSAVYSEQANTLELAAQEKLAEICRQLDLSANDHLLEIGTGWGGMAIYAATHYGCQVTTTTISHEQYNHATAQVKALGLEQQITVLCEDYRNLSGSYDKLVSIEMIEAVGHEFYSSYFECCSKLLKPEGKMVIQAITMTDQRFESAKNSVDFIKRYIFPGGCLPSINVIAHHIAKDTDMQIVHLRDITQDYATTLADWRDRFTEQIPRIQDMGFDQRFIRMWEFYLCYCEGGFRERIIGTVQVAFTKPGYRLAQ